MDNVLSTNFYGYDCEYRSMLDKMHDIHKLIANKEHCNHLMLLEHKSVITYTLQHGTKNIITSKNDIINEGIDLQIADRGGDITFHGPGQLVGYPLIDLNSIGAHSLDVSFYMSKLQNALLDACIDLGINNALLIPNKSGVWIKNNHNNTIKLKKLIAIGVGISKGVSKHGFALNIDIDYLQYVKHIIPCGLKGFHVISMKEIFNTLNQTLPSKNDISQCVSKHIANNFGLTLKF